ncbi:Ton complex subunit ExbD [Desulfovibrionales bacterium]
MAVNLKHNGLTAEINVTPFVDVMLVLLIIFMVTAPMLTQGLEVDLPQTRTVEALPIGADHMVLTVGKDGSMALDEYQVTLETLQPQVKQNVVDKKKQLFIRADRDVAYGIVVRVMGLLKEVSVDRLGIVAESEFQTEVSKSVAPAATQLEKKAPVRKL